MKKLYGVITAMTTPFDKNNKVDIGGIQTQVDFLINKGVNCLYPLGTTGEMYLMSVEERKLVAETVVKKAAGRVTVYIHCGAMTTEDTIQLAKHAYEIRADGIGVVTPSFFTANDRAIIQYYVDIASSIPEDFPMYLYGIPQCSTNDIKPEVAQEIANKCKNVIGIKYSYPDVVRIAEYLRINEGRFSVLMGPDKLFYPGLCMGCDGTVSGCSGPMPEVFVDIYKAYLEGDHEKARKAQDKASACVDVLKAGADMGVFKEVLRKRGIVDSYMRKPLLNIEEKDKEALWENVSKFL
ncbi:dihydrodipicolinate synthase family protein [Natronincola ferrireducens]|nr:dihydrodipicolinate synthase family protein [Natronincola ferrireducens]